MTVVVLVHSRLVVAANLCCTLDLARCSLVVRHAVFECCEAEMLAVRRIEQATAVARQASLV